MHVWAVTLPLDLSCNSKPHKNIFDGRTVVHYAEHPYMTCSFQVTQVNMHKYLIRKRLQCMFEVITHQSYFTSSLTQKMDISNSRAVIAYFECACMTGRF